MLFKGFLNFFLGFVNVTIKCKNAQGFISFFVNGDKVRSLYLLGELLRREKRFACWHFSFEEKYPKEGGGCDSPKPLNAF